MSPLILCRIMQRIGVDPYTTMTWRARIAAHRAGLEIVVLSVLMLYLALAIQAAFPAWSGLHVAPRPNAAPTQVLPIA